MKKTVLGILATATLLGNNVNPELTTFRAGDRVNVGDVNGNFESLKQGILDLQEVVKAQATQISGLQTTVTSQESKITTLQSEKEALSTEVSTLETSNSTLSTKVTNQATQISTLETENQNLKTELSEPRKIFYTTGYQEDGRDDDKESLDSRVLNISKDKSDTAIRITYTDTLRVYTSSGACQYELRVFDQYGSQQVQCNNLKFVLFDSSGDGSIQNHHRTSTLSGVCEKLPVGDYIVKAYVTNEFTDLGGTDYSGANCFTGWNTQFLLQAEEIYKAEVE
jgi:FtsZ-binding cell division protein ZapB